MNWQDLADLFGQGIPLSALDITVALAFSFVCSAVAVLLYNYFYGSRNIGAGVQRSFLLMGPAITAIFLGIQFSLPLSLGLLGALSIIRFRTPVKDPAEIGFIMLLIGASIGSATFNFLLVGILFIIAIIALVCIHLVRGRTGGARSSLIITMDNPEDIKLEEKLTAFLSGRLQGITLQSVATQADSASLHYQFSKRSGVAWGAFTEEIKQAAAPASVSIFIS